MEVKEVWVTMFQRTAEDLCLRPGRVKSHSLVALVVPKIEAGEFVSYSARYPASSKLLIIDHRASSKTRLPFLCIRH